MEEGCLDVVLLQVPVQGCGNMCDGLERLEPGGRSSRLIIVDAVLLSVPFCDVPDLVSDHLSSVIPFPFAHQFAFQGADPTWDVGTWDKDKYLEVLEAAYLVITAGNPILLLR